VDVAGLPDWSEVSLNRLASAYLPYALFVNILFAAVIAVAAGIAGWLMFSLWIGVSLLAAGLVLLGGALSLHAWMEYRLFGWALREQDLINKDGVVWRKVTVMPFSRIQHVSTGNGPVERWFGLMHLKCFSAGGATADVMVQGLTPDTAERLRRYILARLENEEEGESTLFTPPEFEGPSHHEE